MGQDCISFQAFLQFIMKQVFLATESVQERSNINYSIDPQLTD